MPEFAGRFDVFREGGGVRRDVPVVLDAPRLRCGELELALDAIYWVARRAGLLLVFARHTSLALKADPSLLDRLARALERIVDRTEVRRRVVRDLGSEVVLFTAGAAVAGRVRGEPVAGLRVVAATRRGFHLVGGEERRTIRWPVARAELEEGDGRGERLRIVDGPAETDLRVRYLFSEEIRAVLEVATRPPATESAERAGSLEMFRRGEVAPPTPPELPEFSLAAGSLQEVADRAAANVPGELRARALLPPHFFETHFLELGETALGPLLLRKSAASSAGSLREAVHAMDAAGLRGDTRAAVETAAERLVAVHDAELRRVGAEKRLPTRVVRDLGMSGAEMEDLQTRMLAPFEDLWSRFGGLEEQQEELLARLGELEEGPPGVDESEVRSAADAWRAALARLDSGYEAAWRELVEEIERTWSAELLPRLARAAALRRRRMPEGLQLALLAVATMVLVALLVFLIIG